MIAQAETSAKKDGSKAEMKSCRLTGACSWSRHLELQRVDVLDVRRLPRAVERDDDGQADRDFRGGDGDDEEHEDLAVVVGQAIRRR